MLQVGPASADEFHSSPYCWDEARTYASEELARIDVAIAQIDIDKGIEGTLSPNGAYEFDITGQSNGAHPEWRPRLLVFNERPYLLEIQFPSTKTISDAEWINENLIFVRLWRGRIAGSDFIIDVEKEAIVYQQPIRQGEIAFEQYKQCSEEEWKDEEHCRCFDEAESNEKSIAEVYTLFTWIPGWEQLKGLERSRADTSPGAWSAALVAGEFETAVEETEITKFQIKLADLPKHMQLLPPGTRVIWHVGWWTSQDGKPEGSMFPVPNQSEKEKVEEAAKKARLYLEYGQGEV